MKSSSSAFKPSSPQKMTSFGDISRKSLIAQMAPAMVFSSPSKDKSGSKFRSPYTSMIVKPQPLGKLDERPVGSFTLEEPSMKVEDPFFVAAEVTESTTQPISEKVVEEQDCPEPEPEQTN